MASLKIFIVDAFSNDQRPFTGNAAAVCLVPVNLQLDEATFYRIAAEMNQTETAFVQCLLAPGVHITNDGQAEYRTQRHYSLRWFTPTTEVRLCGHGTLAAAHVLFNEMDNTHDELHFESLSGLLRVTKDPQPRADRLALLLPTDAPLNLGLSSTAPDDETNEDPALQSVPSERRAQLRQIVDLVFIHPSPTTVTAPPKILTVLYGPRNHNLLVHIQGGPATLDHLNPVFPPAVLALGHACKLASLIVTTDPSDPLDPSTHGLVRVFAPWVGVYEDPATGSAYTSVAPYWSKILGKHELIFTQGKVRKGRVYTLLNPGTSDYLQVSGSAVTILTGRFQL
ncbi:hypothetical protein H4R33_001550 [Dimargaris cristalligena]|uniref:Uncharacterized protein n=1 Tax=Dimargaris cristalligena TaxID=215637 RepID=A0A4P9ZZQ1_9FUNG|nr:hypothetical protein H4R33_001550 [Dimargaris cristalligena]RKP38432.1 hypothetical protein BJ085DRAFT_30042 [Dimargaris cristalligena]|eukprot:RKP38432.1 hypothetical protein BJ085DRAFT_30042 [Dimargaris cristalligena]